MHLDAMKVVPSPFGFLNKRLCMCLKIMCSGLSFCAQQGSVSVTRIWNLNVPGLEKYYSTHIPQRYQRAAPRDDCTGLGSTTVAAAEIKTTSYWMGLEFYHQCLISPCPGLLMLENDFAIAFDALRQELQPILAATPPCVICNASRSLAHESFASDGTVSLVMFMPIIAKAIHRQFLSI